MRPVWGRPPGPFFFYFHTTHWQLSGYVNYPGCKYRPGYHRKSVMGKENGYSVYLDDPEVYSGKRNTANGGLDHDPGEAGNGLLVSLVVTYTKGYKETIYNSVFPERGCHIRKMDATQARKYRPNSIPG